MNTSADHRDAQEHRRKRLPSRRVRHQHRPLILRWATVAGGLVLALLGMALLLPVIEAGVALLIAGLAVLALEYSWEALGGRAVQPRGR